MVIYRILQTYSQIYFSVVLNLFFGAKMYFAWPL